MLMWGNSQKEKEASPSPGNSVLDPSDDKRSIQPSPSACLIPNKRFNHEKKHIFT